MTEQRETGFGGLWQRMRDEERADQLAQVVQDAVSDAKVAELLDAGAAGHRSP